MKQNKEKNLKKPRPNKYQVAAKTGELLKKYAVPLATGVAGIVVTKFVDNKFNHKK